MSVKLVFQAWKRECELIDHLAWEGGGEEQGNIFYMSCEVGNSMTALLVHTDDTEN